MQVVILKYHASSSFCEGVKMDFFVYYKVLASDARDLQPRVRDLLKQARDAFGVSAKLMRRPEEDSGVQTWMEAYTDVPPGFDEWLTCASERHEVLPLTSGQRHVEPFIQVWVE